MRFLLVLALITISSVSATAVAAPGDGTPPVKTKLVCQGKVSTLLHDGARTRVFDANEVHTLVDAKPRRVTYNTDLCHKVAFTSPALALPFVWNRTGFMGVDCSLPQTTTIWILRYESAVVIKLGYGGAAHVFDQQGTLGNAKPRTGWNTTHCRPIGT